MNNAWTHASNEMTAAVDTAGPPGHRRWPLVGDVIVAFDGEAVQEPEDLLTRLRGDRLGLRLGVIEI